MIRHAGMVRRDGIVGTEPSMISGRQGDSKDAWRKRFMWWPAKLSHI
jgi:hypothetical protein